MPNRGEFRATTDQLLGMMDDLRTIEMRTRLSRQSLACVRSLRFEVAPRVTVIPPTPSPGRLFPLQTERILMVLVPRRGEVVGR